MADLQSTKTWLFDLDDTLYAPSEFSSQMKQKSRSTAAKHLGVTLEECNKHCTELMKKHGGVPFTGLYKEKNVDMHVLIEEAFDLDFNLLKTCEETRCELEGLDGKKIIFTNSPNVHATRVLDTLNYKHIFDDIFDVTAFDFDSKPNLAPYHHVLDKLNEKPENCIMVEDSLKNLKTAKALGMTTVYVYGTEEDVNGIADYSYATLLDFLKDAKNIK